MQQPFGAYFWNVTAASFFHITIKTRFQTLNVQRMFLNRFKKIMNYLILCLLLSGFIDNCW